MHASTCIEVDFVTKYRSSAVSLQCRAVVLKCFETFYAHRLTAKSRRL